MEEISSQNSDLGLEDLDKLEEKGQAENTNLREPLRGGSKNSRNDATNEAESWLQMCNTSWAKGTTAEILRWS